MSQLRPIVGEGEFLVPRPAGSPPRRVFLIIVWSLLFLITGSAAQPAFVTPAPFTLTTSVLFDAPESVSGPEVWLAGAAEGPDAETQALTLGWVEVVSGWFPKWQLRLQARAGLLDPAYVDGAEGSVEWVLLQDGSIGRSPFQTGDLYQAQLSHDPATGRLAFKIVNRTQGETVHAASIRLEQGVTLYPPSAEALTTRFAHVKEANVQQAYVPLGPPLVMQRQFEWQLAEIVEGGQPGERRFRFTTQNQPGILLTWPPEPVPGEVRIVLRKGEDGYDVGAQTWTSTPQALPFPKERLPFGESTLELIYSDGENEWPIATGRFGYIRGTVDVSLQEASRDRDGGLSLKLLLIGSGALDAVPVDLDISYTPGVDAVEPLSWTKREIVTFPEAGSVEVAFDIPIPAAEGRVSIVPSSPDESVLVRSGNLAVTVSEVAPFQVEVAHERLTPVLGEPALIRVGDTYPVVTLSAIRWEGTVRASLVHGSETLVTLPAQRVAPGMQLPLAFPGGPDRRGRYEIRILFERENLPNLYHTLHFVALDTDEDESAARQVAYLGPGGKLEYAPDYLGNQIPDFSYAGYGGGGVAIPDVPVVRTVEPQDGDDTERIQAAINEVAALPADENGFRGAVLLKRGTYEVGGTLQIQTSGIVLRGEGDGEDGTILIATGSRARNLIRVAGPFGATVLENTGRRITDLYVPVGARSFHVEFAEDLKVGDTIVVRRYGNAEWIHEIGMDQFPPTVAGRAMVQWTPFHLDFERVITSIEGDLITVDAPVVNAIDHRWGGGEVFLVQDRRIEQVGVENLRAISEFDPSVTCQHQGEPYPCDENHAEYLVTFNNVKNAWARNLTAIHFTHGITLVSGGAKWLTVQDTHSLAPVSELAGSRRYPYHVLGQLVLVQRAYSEGARHAFAFNRHVTGPNVFLYSRSEVDYANSEPHRHWAVAGLYDNVKGPIAIQDRWTHGSGHGWSGANFVAWNTEGTLIVQSPPTAVNWAIGHVGTRALGHFLPRPQGYWVSHGQHVEPQSLYLKQLEDRLGPDAVRNIGYEPGAGR